MTPREYKHEESWLLEGKEDNVVIINARDIEECSVEKAAEEHEDSSNCLPGLLIRIKIGAYFALWYALNIVYNILNKQVLNVLPAPLTVGCLQFGVGAVYVGFLWLLSLRERPQLLSAHRINNNLLLGGMYPIGLFHCLGQLCTMVSLGSAPVAFTHIVKALEPFFSALVSTLLLRKYMSVYVYATLIPVVGGVGFACWHQSSFSWLAFGTAMASNLAFALRAVLSKMAMSPLTNPSNTVNNNKSDSSNDDNDLDGDLSTNQVEALSPVNVFGVVTWIAFVLSIPIALITEGASFLNLWKRAVLTQTDALLPGGEDFVWYSDSSLQLMQGIVLSGFFHYMNNEVMYLALDKVHPVTLAVGNTMKRAFIMVASVLFFHTRMSPQSVLGSSIGIGGVLLYSLTIHYYEQDQKKMMHAALIDKQLSMVEWSSEYTPSTTITQCQEDRHVYQ